MKPIRWTDHAKQNLILREIDPEVAYETLRNPESIISISPSRQIWMKKYFDQTLNQEMLLRIVIEETIHEWVVITIYKTSRILKYTQGTQS